MCVSDVYCDNAYGRANRRLLEAAVLCNHAHLGSDPMGEPMELALLQHAKEAGIDVEALRRQCPQLHEIPFDSVRKRMSSVHQMPQGTRMMVRGHWNRCCRAATVCWWRDEHCVCAATVSGSSRRVHSWPKRPNGSWHSPIAERMDLSRKNSWCFSGSSLLSIRFEGVAESVETARRAGIDVVMITGDHPMTTLAIARSCRLHRERMRVLSGAQLDALDETSLRRQIRKVRVFAK
ncbi:MAG: hypothetical protein ACLVJ6_01110 [Merdibacter sp.]